jgi:hypothetical protein
VLSERFMLALVLSVVDIAERVMALVLRLREGNGAELPSENRRDGG